MKMTRVIAALALAVSMPLLSHSQTLHQGTVLSPFSESRLLADLQFGDDTTFGFGATAFGWGLGGELPLGPSLPAGGRRFEYQPSFTVLLGPRLSYRNGSLENQQNLEVNNQGLIWTNHRLAVAGGYKYAAYWAEGLSLQNAGYTIHRSGWAPNLGGVIRDTLLGRPGRFYADYVFPTGCQETTASNPCVTPAPRTQGVEMMQELRAATYLRVGAELSVVRYDEPPAPNGSGIPPLAHMAVYATIHLKFERPASPLQDGGIY